MRVHMQCCSECVRSDITVPPARNNGTVELAGNCDNYACFWFSQLTSIPGEPTLPDEARMFSIKVTSGPNDWSAKNPWRAPGTAPVYCNMARAAAWPAAARSRCTTAASRRRATSRAWTS